MNYDPLRQCCELDTNFDGTCDRHPGSVAPRVRIGLAVEALALFHHKFVEGEYGCGWPLVKCPGVLRLISRINQALEGTELQTAPPAKTACDECLADRRQLASALQALVNAVETLGWRTDVVSNSVREAWRDASAVLLKTQPTAAENTTPPTIRYVHPDARVLNLMLAAAHTAGYLKDTNVELSTRLWQSVVVLCEPTIEQVQYDRR